MFAFTFCLFVCLPFLTAHICIKEGMLYHLLPELIPHLNPVDDSLIISTATKIMTSNGI